MPKVIEVNNCRECPLLSNAQAILEGNVLYACIRESPSRLIKCGPETLPEIPSPDWCSLPEKTESVYIIS